MSDQQHASARTLEHLLAEVERLRSEVAALDADRARRAEFGADRRRAIRIAGAAAAATVVGTVTGAGPAAASDPNDVVKNAANAVTSTTSLSGSFNSEVLRLTNTAGAGRALLASSQGQDIGAVRGDNSNDSGIGGVGVSGNAPGGRDFLAFGSGRIGLNSHAFSTVANQYTVGEIHQSAGTLYAMVGSTTRRSIAGPATAGALYPVDPFRAYDSRRPAPSPGVITAGSSRLVSVANARDPLTGAVTTANAVPGGATAVVFNLTVTTTTGTGFLAIAPGSAVSATTSIVNWKAGVTVANSSTVGLDGGRQVRVFAAGGVGASTHFVVDVLGYYL